MQLSEPCVADTLEIGNADSAFVEVTVGRQADDTENWQASYLEYLMYISLHLHAYSIGAAANRRAHVALGQQGTAKRHAGALVPAR